MKRATAASNGFSIVEIVLLLAVLIILGFTGYYFYFHSHKTSSMTVPNKTTEPSASLKANSYTYAGFLFPDMPSSYAINDKEASGGGSGIPTIDYLTPNSTSQIINDVEAICRKAGLTLDTASANSYVSTSTISQSGGPSYTNESVQCHDANNSWVFAIAQGLDLKYQTGIPQQSSQTTASLGSQNWLEVQSMGPPVNPGGLQVGPH